MAEINAEKAHFPCLDHPKCILLHLQLLCSFLAFFYSFYFQPRILMPFSKYDLCIFLHIPTYTVGLSPLIHSFIAVKHLHQLFNSLSCSQHVGLTLDLCHFESFSSRSLSVTTLHSNTEFMPFCYVHFLNNHG